MFEVQNQKTSNCLWDISCDGAEPEPGARTGTRASSVSPQTEHTATQGDLSPKPRNTADSV